MKRKPHRNKQEVMGWIRRVGASFTLVEAARLWDVDKATMRDWYYLADCVPKGSRDERARDLGISHRMICVPMTQSARAVRLIRRERKASRRALAQLA